MEASRKLIGVLLWTFVLILNARGDVQNVVDVCCEIGTQRAIDNQYCDDYPGVVVGIDETESRMCLSMIEICCLKSKQIQMCERGELEAKDDLSRCIIRRDVFGADAYSECCHCCKMGLEARKYGLGCDQPNIGNPCDGKFMECCMDGSENSGANTTVLPVTTIPTVPPEIDSMNECEVFGDQLCSQRCVNTIGSFYCECEEGYTLAQDGRTCIEKVQTCAEAFCSQNCIDTGRGPVCRCRRGYQLQEDRRTCRDVDECQMGRDNCRPGENCVNTEGSFQCFPADVPTCRQGYVYDTLRGSCVVDPNLQQPGCDTGFAYNTITAACEDIDECIVQMDNCNDVQETCYNTYGSFYCRCKTGYRRNRSTRLCEDIDECAMNINTCLSSQRCENTVGSYTCRRLTPCGTGWTLDEDTQRCVDQDECKLGTHNCGVGYECYNIEGSFRCNPKACRDGFRFSASTGKCERVQCPRGLRADSGSICNDINECERPDICKSYQTCLNSYGSYRCVDPINCRPGFTVDVDGKTCVDINECETGDHDCEGKSECVNLSGTFTCSCPPGYSRVNRRCVDKNECRLGSRCPPESTCENTVGSYKCNCNPGLQQVGQQCLDIDECRDPNRCQHRCENTVGTFYCACNKGYQLAADKRSCEDVNECQKFSRRGGLCAGSCINTPGSYRCTCPQGWNVLGNGRSCQDVNECLENRTICGNNSDVMCFNTRGSYKCPVIRCPTGFSRTALGPRRNSEVVVEADDILCQKDCAYWDINCQHNETSSVSYQFLALPTIKKVSQPVVLLNVTAKGFILVPQMFLHIISGNDEGLFETEVDVDTGALRLIKPLIGPAVHRLMLRLENRSYVGNKVKSAHNTHLVIDVSGYEH